MLPCELTKSDIQKISVIVVCHNRQKRVQETVDSLLNQSVKPFEIIVIDDGSDPPLETKVNARNLKLVRFDKEQGLSNARNYGVNIAKSEYVAFIDDDAVASKDWLEEIQKGIKAGADILGGPLEPLFKAKPPEWWNEEDFGFYAGVGNHETQSIWGANMIFKHGVFEKIGFFNPEIGRRHGKLFSGEDSDLLNRAKTKCKILFMPKAKVFHVVKPERMTLRYILRWRYYCGKTIKARSRHKTLITLGTSLRILVIAMVMLNPFISVKKTSRIKKIAELSELLGVLF